MDPQLYHEFYEIEEHFWWSVGTRRTFAQLLGRVAAAKPGVVVDVGCGTGIMLRELALPGRLRCGCDASPIALGLARQRGLADLLRCDATRLPLASGSADLVLALDVIEHLDDDAAALRELARIARPGGHVLVHVPAFPILWTDKDALNHHRRRYRRRQLAALVERAGLAIRHLSYLNAFPFPAALARAGLQALAGRGRTAVPPSTAVVERLYRPPWALNQLLLAMLTLEGWVGPLLPFGMSLVCVAEKPAAVVERAAPWSLPVAEPVGAAALRTPV
jgi:SAM-dependent methyltransferase